MKLRDQIIKDTIITLKPEKFVHQLGPDLRLENCTIISYCTGSAIIFAGVEMIGGIFHQKKSLTNTEFSRTIFDEVKFLGFYNGVDFGHKEEIYEGKIINCDFSEATIHHSRVFECQAEQLILPIWPCFSIINPSQAREYVLSRQWGVKLGITLDIYTDVSSLCTVSLGNAEEISKKAEIGIDDLKKLLKDIPGMIIR